MIEREALKSSNFTIPWRQKQLSHTISLWRNKQEIARSLYFTSFDHNTTLWSRFCVCIICKKGNYCSFYFVKGWPFLSWILLGGFGQVPILSQMWAIRTWNSNNTPKYVLFGKGLRFIELEINRLFKKTRMVEGKGREGKDVFGAHDK